MAKADETKQREQAQEIRKLIIKGIRKRGLKCPKTDSWFWTVDGHTMRLDISAGKDCRPWEKWNGKFRVKVGDYGDTRQFPSRKDGPGVVQGVCIEAVVDEVVARIAQAKEAKAVRIAREIFEENAKAPISEIKAVAGRHGVLLGAEAVVEGKLSGSTESGFVFPAATRVTLRLHDVTLPFAEAKKLLSMMRELTEKKR